MSAKHLTGINLTGCACGAVPLRRSQFVGATTLYWVTCPGCGARTAKSDSEPDAEFAWNEGEVFQAWQLPIETSCDEQAPGPAPAAFHVSPSAPAA